MDPKVATLDPGGSWQRRPLTLAVITGVFGAIMLFWPGATVRVVAILFGFWLIFSGVIMLVQAIGSQGNGFLRALLGIGGVLSLVIGGICVVNGDASERILVLFVVIGWLANGIAYLIVGLRNKAVRQSWFLPVLRDPAGGAGTTDHCLAVGDRDRARACDRDRLAHHRRLRGGRPTASARPEQTGRS